MLNQLIKLANLLDERGQVKVANKVDEMIRKVGQVTDKNQALFDAIKNPVFKTLLDRLIQIKPMPPEALQIIQGYARWIDNKKAPSDILDTEMGDISNWWGDLTKRVFSPIGEAVTRDKTQLQEFQSIQQQLGTHLDKISKAAGQLILPTAPAQPTGPGQPSKAPAKQQATNAPTDQQVRNGTATVRKGMKGAIVHWIQEILNVTPQTGYFGDKTETAVRDFQSRVQLGEKKLKVDGVVGKDTYQALYYESEGKGGAPEKS